MSTKTSKSFTMLAKQSPARWSLVLAAGLSAAAMLAPRAGLTLADPPATASSASAGATAAANENYMATLPANNHFNAPTREAIERAGVEIDKALAYLKTQQNPADHSWEKSKFDPPAITALVCKAFIQSGVDPDTDFIDKAYDHLIDIQKSTGGIYKDVLANYNTAIIISALSAAPEAEWQEPKAKAIEYLKKLQWSDKIEGLPNDEQPVTEKDARWGGWGYGSGKQGRPDLSNTQTDLDALHDAGLSPSDPAFQNALKFIARAQNDSESNDQPWAGNDGGFIYTPANGGMSAAGSYADANGQKHFRSYGSMTYAGLKSMIYAGLSHDDPRVKSAWRWISRNWMLDQNPGLSPNDPVTGENGLYYYYHTLARALHAYGQPIITDPPGKPVITDAPGKLHDWRVELIAKLAELQQPDGHWVGQKKWMEDNPIICSAFATLALQQAVADLKEHPVK